VGTAEKAEEVMPKKQEQMLSIKIPTFTLEISVEDLSTNEIEEVLYDKVYDGLVAKLRADLPVIQKRIDAAYKKVLETYDDKKINKMVADAVRDKVKALAR
jgi:hypothetical protein